MDIEKIKQQAAELAQLLGGELKGSQSYTFKAFCESVDAIINYHVANLNVIMKKVSEMEAERKANEISVN